jgi:hypothetical protein
MKLTKTKNQAPERRRRRPEGKHMSIEDRRDERRQWRFRGKRKTGSLRKLWSSAVEGEDKSVEKSVTKTLEKKRTNKLWLPVV